ncbi:MAG: FAD-dependent oxidoreductase, partial [Clostridia bacterium]|nr:FAD-dependent oxidoreductase [Clostridia bacterium]
MKKTAKAVFALLKTGRRRRRPLPEHIMQKQTEIAIIGAGHAGVEAALASARLGLSTVLF